MAKKWETVDTWIEKHKVCKPGIQSMQAPERVSVTGGLMREVWTTSTSPMWLLYQLKAELGHAHPTFLRAKSIARQHGGGSMRRFAAHQVKLDKGRATPEEIAAIKTKWDALCAAIRKQIPNPHLEK